MPLRHTLLTCTETLQVEDVHPSQGTEYPNRFNFNEIPNPSCDIQFGIDVFHLPSALHLPLPWITHDFICDCQRAPPLIELFDDGDGDKENSDPNVVQQGI